MWDPLWINHLLSVKYLLVLSLLIVLFLWQYTCKKLQKTLSQFTKSLYIVLIFCVFWWNEWERERRDSGNNHCINNHWHAQKGAGGLNRGLSIPKPQNCPFSQQMRFMKSAIFSQRTPTSDLTQITLPAREMERYSTIRIL